MDNRDVAAVFHEMGDLLDIQGGDPFRARAFRRTAKIVEDLREPVVQSLAYNRLHSVPGIGPGSVERIKEIVRSGTCGEHQRLRRALPPSLRELLDVKGVGPRVIRIVHKHLGIQNLPQLEMAARTGRLARLPGLNEKSQADILLAIEMHRTKAPRQLLPDALATGDGMVGQVAEHAGVTAVVQCGSARRRTPTVGDLDLVAGTDDGEGTVRRFVSLPEVERVWMQGVGRASVRLQSGQQMDLWTVPPSAYGAGIAAFTNGVRHNIALRLRAAKMGVRVSEFGVVDLVTGRPKGPTPTEAQMYTLLGLDYIPPEIREDTGEVQAAEAHKLPTLVEDHDLRGDLQVHTSLAAGSADLETMARAARAAGREWIAVTDRWTALAAPLAIQSREEERRRVEDRVGIGILLGVEVDILASGELALPHNVLASFDWVVGAIDEEPGADPADVTERLVCAIDSGALDALGHPTGRRLLEHDGFDVDIDRVAKAALRRGVALEVNGDPRRIDLDDKSVRHARDLGVTFALSSDARAPHQLTQLHWAVLGGRRGWLRARDVLNSLTYEDIRDRRKDKTSTVPRARAVRTGEPTGPSPEAAALLAQMSGGLSNELRARVEAFVKSGNDPELEAALKTLSDNPLQAAFNLLMASAGPQILD
jgi:DNA polymerase (family 10)